MKSLCRSIAILGLLILFLPNTWAQRVEECLDTFPQQCGESTQLARLSPAMMGSVPVGGGEATYYYANGGTNSYTICDDWQTNNSQQTGGYVTIGINGTATKLGIRMVPGGSARVFHLCLYPSNGSSCIASCDATSTTGAVAEWVECTDSTSPPAVTASTQYLIIGALADAVGSPYICYRNDEDGHYTGSGFSSCPASTSYINDEGSGTGYRVYVVP